MKKAKAHIDVPLTSIQQGKLAQAMNEFNRARAHARHAIDTETRAESDMWDAVELIVGSEYPRRQWFLTRHEDGTIRLSHGAPPADGNRVKL